jgi:hypothetical protein
MSALKMKGNCSLRPLLPAFLPDLNKTFCHGGLAGLGVSGHRIEGEFGQVDSGVWASGWGVCMCPGEQGDGADPRKRSKMGEWLLQAGCPTK